MPVSVCFVFSDFKRKKKEICGVSEFQFAPELICYCSITARELPPKHVVQVLAPSPLSVFNLGLL